MKKLVAAGLVITKDGKLILTRKKGKEMYKIPGGKPEEGESLEECAIREFEEETGFAGKIVGKYETMVLDKNPETGEEMGIELYHFKGEILSREKRKLSYEHGEHEVAWLEIEKIKKGEYDVAPNVMFVIEKEKL
jgi:ADP-ribose pyrophosphatase YjhB (NUDIX family)